MTTESERCPFCGIDSGELIGLGHLASCPLGSGQSLPSNRSILQKMVKDQPEAMKRWAPKIYEQYLPKSEVPSPQELQEPEVGSVWKHRKTGNWYIVQEVVIFEEDLEPLVIYFSTEKIWRKWARRRTLFYEKFTKAT